MEEKELREFIREKMQEEIHPLVSKGCSTIADLITDAFNKGFELGLAVGQKTTPQSL